MMVIMFAFPPFLWFLFRYLGDKFFKGNPVMEAFLPLMAGFVAFMIPMLMAFVIGFMFLDEKDDKIWFALQVVPISPIGFLAYRMAFGFAFSFIFSIITPYMLNFFTYDFGTVLAMSFIGAMQTPILGLAISMKAKNKVEGMAVFKLVGFLLMLPLMQSFITADWVYIFALIPTYWPTKIMLTAFAGDPTWIPILIGLVYHVVLVVLVAYLFKKLMFR
jgi:hypothetical protein